MTTTTEPAWKESPRLAAELYVEHVFYCHRDHLRWLLIGTCTRHGLIWRLIPDETPEAAGIHIHAGNSATGAIAQANQTLDAHVPVRRLATDIANSMRWTMDRALLYVRQQASEKRGTTEYSPDLDSFTNAGANRVVNALRAGHRPR